MISRISPSTPYPGICRSLASTYGSASKMEAIRNFNCLRTVALLALLIFCAAQAAVAADVHGTATNAQDGEPLGKIQVAILGTRCIAATGPDGVFHISKVPPGSYVLQISGVGYRTLSVPFQLAETDENREFLLALTPDNFRRTDVVE